MKETKKALAREWVRQCALAAMVLAASALRSEAQTNVLSARDTSLQIVLGGTSPGLSDWTINGINQLDYQWFYYSIGSGTVNSIDTIAPWSTPIITGGNNPTLTETYANSTNSVKTVYDLESGQTGSGKASLQTTVTIQNLSAASETYNFYQFSDFYLGGVSGNQNVQFTETTAPYQVVQTGATGGPLVGSLTSISGGTSDSVGEIAGLYNGTQFGLQNGNPAPTFNDTFLSAGPGNVDFAYEVSATLAAGSSITISEIQTVPEPSPLALMGLGVGIVGWFYRRKMSFKK